VEICGLQHRTLEMGYGKTEPYDLQSVLGNMHGIGDSLQGKERRNGQCDL